MSGYLRRAGLIVCVCATLGVVILGVAVLTVKAANISGKVQVSGSGLRDDHDADVYWKVWNGALPYRALEKDVQRELAAALIGNTDDAKDCEYALRGGNFMPSTMLVPSGREVTIKNGDGFDYEIDIPDLNGFETTTVSPEHALSVKIPSGKGKSAHDLVHSHVRGTLIPLENLQACARVGSDGSLTFTNIAPGTYTMKVYWGDKEISSSKIEMTDKDVTFSDIRAHVQKTTGGTQ